MQQDPIRTFSSWYREAVKRSPGPWFDPTAMTLATSDREGNVTARIVLLKTFGPEGFTFFTNYASRKGNQLAQNPRAALVMYWPMMKSKTAAWRSVSTTAPQTRIIPSTLIDRWLAPL